MCGIVGYLGTKPKALDVVLGGLRALEYRGYDSAGIALQNSKTKTATLIKQAGRVEGLEKATADLSGQTNLAIGHTRWATHGTPTLLNAHPHSNSAGTIFVVHNGIIENYAELRANLIKKGYEFVSETDTEVIPHLIDYYLGVTKSFDKAFKAALKDVRGAYAILAMTTLESDRLYAARLSSPLVIGIGKDEFVVASDATAIMQHTKKVVYLDDYEVAVIDKAKYRIEHLTRAVPVEHKAELLDFDVNQTTRGSYPDFMLKEIFEAPATIRLSSLGRANAKTNTIKLGGLENVRTQLKNIERIVIVACGTSYYAGLVGEYLIEELAGIPVEVQLASEFKYRNEPFSRSTALLAISQSGETADTIAALKKVEDYGVLRLGIVNAIGSTIARMTDAGVYCHAGPEQAVASTKAFIAQVMVLTLIGLELSDGASPLYKPLIKEIDDLPAKAEQVLAEAKKIEKLAKKYANYRDFLFIGRHYGYPCAMEGALKLKEVSYIHAEGYAAGEMKHGPLAMIDKNFPTFALAPDSPLLAKTISNIEEIKARRGPVIAIATEGNKTVAKLANDVIYIPKSLEQTQPILVAIAMQLFSYYAARSKNLDVDRPRNLAKSVTVE